MRFIFSLLLLVILILSGWYAWNNIPQAKEVIHALFKNDAFPTLEIRYTAEEIMQHHRDLLIKNMGYSYLEPQLLYYPYLLMDVKYSKDSNTTCEATILWGLTDGEMVLDTASWRKTHGFEDCLIAKASKHDFKIIKALIENGGIIDQDKLYQSFQTDQERLDSWINSCREKKLIVMSGNKFRLHLANPHLTMQPVTQLHQTLVSQPAKYSLKVKNHYSPLQIKKLAQVAFGKDFAIRKTQEVFLPVYSIGIQNPDGSTRTVYFNALNGKHILPNK